MTASLRNEKCALVLERVARGDKVRFLQDFYGVQYAELVPRWQFWRGKTRVRLSALEIDRLKAALRSQRIAGA